MWRGSDAPDLGDASGHALPQPAAVSMRVARSYLGYASDNNGNAYAIGGLDDAGTVLSSAEVIRIDSPNPSWSSIAAACLVRA